MPLAKPLKPVALPVGQPAPIRNAADHLSISVKTLTRAAADERVKLIRFGRRLFVPFDEVQRLAREGL